MKAPQAFIAVLAAGFALVAPVQAQEAAPDTRPFQRVADISAFSPLATVKGGASERPLPVATGPRFSAATLKAVQDYSDAAAGKALLIWQGGTLQYESYAPGLDARSRFNVFSMTKTVLGLTYGAAIRDGVIGSLDAPVGRYVTEWAGEPRGAITLRQLLTMSSGLTLYSLARPDARTFAMTYGPDVTRLSLETPAASPPGQVFEYNNINSQIAGVALDRALKAAGKGGYIDYLSTALWRPLGQADAQTWLEHENGYPRFYSGLLTGARDWLRLGLLVKDHGSAGGRQVLPAAWIDEMTSPSAHNPNYGLQIWMGPPWRRNVPGGPTSASAVLASEPYAAPDLIFFNGAFGQRVYISRALDLVVVRIGEQRPGWDDSVIPNLLARDLNPVRPSR